MRTTGDYIGSTDSGAYFSPCRRYRYTLWRRWKQLFAGGEGERLLSVIALNPSTADEHRNDRTISRLISFAKAWGYDGLAMMNLFGFRETDPELMKKEPEPVGPENDAVLLAVTAFHPTVICCWGVDGKHAGRAEEVLQMLRGRQLCHLGLTKDGYPRHPLYLPGKVTPIPWENQRIS